MKIVKTTLALVLAAAMLGGCYTTATINTEPQGAKVWVKGKYRGRSPVEVELKDGTYASTSYIKLEKEGYKTTEVPVKPTWSPGFVILNVLLFLPTLGLSYYFCLLNCKTHSWDYSFPLEPAAAPANRPPPVKQAPPPMKKAPPPAPAPTGVQDIS